MEKEEIQKVKDAIIQNLDEGSTELAKDERWLGKSISLYSAVKIVQETVIKGE